MSCAVSVNRALCVLAAVWVMIPAVAVPGGAEPVTEGTKPLPIALGTEADDALCGPSADAQLIACSDELETLADSR